jgi:hypothetical protein
VHWALRLLATGTFNDDGCWTDCFALSDLDRAEAGRKAMGVIAALTACGARGADEETASEKRESHNSWTSERC